MRPEQIPYGVKDFRRIRLENFYYVDKTEYIRRMEIRANFLFFVRPRRFGKTLLCETLKCYYDVAEKENFGRLFGDLAIGRNPTDQANRYFVLVLDFSQVGKSAAPSWSEKFERYMLSALRNFALEHRRWLETVADVDKLVQTPDAGVLYDALVPLVRQCGFRLYVIVDEYDNFTNEIVSSAANVQLETLNAQLSPPNSQPLAEYRAITHGTGFYRGWFKTFKATCDRIFMTGVSPVTMDDLTSGFNIATNISQEPEFNAMVGFTHAETRKLFEDFRGAGRYLGDAEPHLRTVKAWYDGYCFSEAKIGEELVFNCDMALYYLSFLVANGAPPKKLIDANIRSDWNKLRTILAAQRHAETVDGVLPLTEELADHDEVTFDLVDSFPVERVLDEKNFKSLYYYYGIVTMGRTDFDQTYFRIPNECVRRQVFEYMRSEYAKEADAVDLTEFATLFRGFARDGEWRMFLTYLAEKYRAYGSSRDGIGGEARINGFLRAYLTMNSSYVVKPELELNGGFSDYVLLPDPNAGPATPGHSYVIEMKHAPAKASDAELAAKHEEAVTQLKKYAADPNLPALAAGTPVHFLVYEFRGRELVRLEELA